MNQLIRKKIMMIHAVEVAEGKCYLVKETDRRKFNIKYRYLKLKINLEDI